MDGSISRRNFLGAAISLPLVGAGLTGCAAATPFLNWLAPFAQSVAAGVVASYAETGIGNFARWMERIEKKLPDLAPHYISNFYSRQDKPVVLVGLLNSEDADPNNDRLAAFVNGGKKAIVFESWAWHAVSLLCAERLEGVADSSRADMQRLLGAGLAPAAPRSWKGTTPAGSVEYLTYKSSIGYVEVVLLAGEVTITAYGLPDGDLSIPLQRSYDPNTYVYVAA